MNHAHCVPNLTRSLPGRISSCTGPGRRLKTSRCRRPLRPFAFFKGCENPLPKPIKVVGCGSAGIDYLASVPAYPKPDEKIRTLQLKKMGGGNCANALTAAARLGLDPVIISKVGGDVFGDEIISELQGDGVDTQLLIKAPGQPSMLVYIIVDQESGTRTCIHTPSAPLEPSELTPELIDSALAGAQLAYFDGRSAEAALLLAGAAKARGLPVVVEAERPREGLDQLLQVADYVVTSAHFPQAWTGEERLGDALVTMATRLPNCHTFITTRNSSGSILLQRPEALLPAEQATAPELQNSRPESLEEVLASLASSLEAAKASQVSIPEFNHALGSPARPCSPAAAAAAAVSRPSSPTARSVAAAAAAAAAAGGVYSRPCSPTAAVMSSPPRSPTSRAVVCEVEMQLASSVDCITPLTRLRLQRPPLVSTPGLLALRLSNIGCSSSGSSMGEEEEEPDRLQELVVAAAALQGHQEAAPEQEATNRGPTQHMSTTSRQPASAASTLTARVTLAAAVALPDGAVADTTGAGDSFFGSVLYGIATGMPASKMLQLASVVAASKCTSLGARSGLPRRRDLSENLLEP